MIEDLAYWLMASILIISELLSFIWEKLTKIRGSGGSRQREPSAATW